MQGLTEILFRSVYNRCFKGAFDSAVSPFLSLTHGNLTDAWKKIDDVLPEVNKGSMPVIPQILGKECEEFVSLANRLGEIGYNEVNWNIGCPMRRVAGKHRGSGILPYPDEVRHVLDNVVPRLDIQLSIKMRLGHIHDNEIFKLIPILNDYPLKSITIHPRTGKQQYSGSVNLHRFEEVLPLIKHKVIYNGDICKESDYRHIRQLFPQITDVMIGRGALYDPLLVPRLKGMDVDEGDARNFILQLIDAILHRPISDEGKTRKIKEYWCLLWKATALSETASHKVLHTTTLPDLISTLTRILNNEEQ